MLYIVLHSTVDNMQETHPCGGLPAKSSNIYPVDNVSFSQSVFCEALLASMSRMRHQVYTVLAYE